MCARARRRARNAWRVARAQLFARVVRVANSARGQPLGGVHPMMLRWGTRQARCHTWAMQLPCVMECMTEPRATHVAHGVRRTVGRKQQPAGAPRGRCYPMQWCVCVHAVYCRWRRGVWPPRHQHMYGGRLAIACADLGGARRARWQCVVPTCRLQDVPPAPIHVCLAGMAIFVAAMEPTASTARGLPYTIYAGFVKRGWAGHQLGACLLPGIGRPSYGRLRACGRLPRAACTLLLVDGGVVVLRAAGPTTWRALGSIHW